MHFNYFNQAVVVTFNFSFEEVHFGMFFKEASYRLFLAKYDAFKHIPAYNYNIQHPQESLRLVAKWHN